MLVGGLQQIIFKLSFLFLLISALYLHFLPLEERDIACACCEKGIIVQGWPT